MLAKLPPALSQSIICRQSQAYGNAEDIFGDEVVKYAAFRGKVLKHGGYTIALNEFCMVGEWFETFTLNSLVVRPYPHRFHYNPKTVLKRYMAGFLRNILRYTILVQCLGLHPDESVIQFAKWFSNIGFSSLADMTTILDIVWPVEKLIKGNKR